MSSLKISLIVVVALNTLGSNAAERDSLLSGRVQGYGAAAAYAPLQNSDEVPSLAEQATISFARFKSEVNLRNQLRVPRAEQFKKGSFMRNSLQEVSFVSARVLRLLDPRVEELAREQGKVADIGKALSAYLALVEEADAELQSLKRFSSFTREQKGRINAREIILREKELEISHALKAVVAARPGNPKDELHEIVNPYYDQRS